MIEYLIIALSFAISSLWFIHKKGLKEAGITDYPFAYNITFILAMTILFPVMLPFWLFDSKEFRMAYTKRIIIIMTERGDII